MTNVHHLDDQRQRRAAYEQQRQIAVDAMRKAAAEFRKLEQFTVKPNIDSSGAGRFSDSLLPPQRSQ